MDVLPILGTAATYDQSISEVEFSLSCGGRSSTREVWRQKPLVVIMALKNIQGLRPGGINSPVSPCTSVEAFLCLVEVEGRI